MSNDSDGEKEFLEENKQETSGKVAEEDDALDIKAEDVDFMDEDNDDYNPNVPPVKPPGAAALWGEENNETNYKAAFKNVDKVTRKLYKRQASQMREKYEKHLARYMEEHPDYNPKEAKKTKKEKRKKKKRKLRRVEEEEEEEEEQHVFEEQQYPNEHDQEEEEVEDIGIEPSVYDKTIMAIASTKRKRRKRDEEDIANDLEVHAKQFIAEMVSSARKDSEGVIAKPPRPAFACLRLLKRLDENMNRTKLLRFMLENNLLCAIRDWLQPYPNGMLPVRQVRDRLYDILCNTHFHKLDNIKAYFEKCQRRTDEAIKRKELRPGTVGLCKLLLQLWKNRKESRANRTKIAGLIQQWVRPLLDARISFKGLRTGVDDPMHRIKARALKAQARPMLVPDSKRTRARVPELPWFSFNKAPVQKEYENKKKEVDMKRKSIEKRFKRLNSDKAVGGCQAATVSITGRR